MNQCRHTAHLLICWPTATRGWLLLLQQRKRKMLSQDQKQNRNSNFSWQNKRTILTFRVILEELSYAHQDLYMYPLFLSLSLSLSTLSTSLSHSLSLSLSLSLSPLSFYIYTYTVSHRSEYTPHIFCQYFIISFHVTTLKKWDFATM